MKKPIFLRVEIDPNVHPRLYDLLEGIKPSMRSEKVRFLSSLGEMIQSGLIDDFGKHIQATVLGSLRILPIPFQNDIQSDDINSSIVKASDFASFLGDDDNDEEE